MHIGLLIDLTPSANTFAHHVWARTMRAGAEALGISVTEIALRDVSVRISDEAIVWQSQFKLPLFDVVINCVRDADDGLADHVLRVLETSGVRVINSASGRQAVSSRPRMLSSLAQKGVPIPHTVVVNSAAELESIVAYCGGLPVILKKLRSSKGVGVVICESMRSLRSMLQVLIQSDGGAVVQEYLPADETSDLKILALREEVLCGFTRRATIPDEFRANVSLGGKADLIAVGGNVSQVATAAVRAVGLDIGSVDIMKKDGALYVIEVNDLPELNITLGDREIVETAFAEYVVFALAREYTGFDGQHVCTNPRSNPGGEYITQLYRADVIYAS